MTLLLALTAPGSTQEAAARSSGRLKHRLASPGAPKRTSSRKLRRARQKARKLVKKGVARLREGDYVAALDLFSRAFKIYPSPKIQFNIGQTYKELGRYLSAISAYERFIKDAPEDISFALRKLARDNIRELYRKIALLRLRISVHGARVSVDGRLRGISPMATPMRLMPGAHSIVVKKPGFVTVALDLRLLPGQRVTRLVTLHKPRPKVVRVIWSTRRKPKKGLPLLWTGVALTGAALLASAVTGAMALVEQSRFDDLDLPLDERMAAGERGRRYQRATDGLLIGAGVVAVATLVWYLVRVRPSGGVERVRQPSSARPGQVLLAPAPGGAGLVISF